MSLAYEERVRHKIRGQHHLVPVFTNALQIPERVREYDADFFVCLNTIRNIDRARGEPPRPLPPGIIPFWGAWFEIHDLNREPPHTAALINKYGALDVRILRDLWRGDLRMRGRQIFREIAAREEARERAAQRDHRNQVQGIADEIRREFANVAWGGGQTIFGPGPRYTDTRKKRLAERSLALYGW